MSEAKNILFLTGTRADFGKLKPLIREVEKASEFEAAIFATGMHMLERYGSTFIEIKKAGFTNIFPYLNQDAQNNSRMDLTLASTIQGLGHYVQEFTPDLLVVHGDRVETLAGAIVGAIENILVAHVEGGEISGTVDELLRHAVSKLSHLHFVSNPEAKQRLVQMGELDESIFVIGSPEVDIMLSEELPSLEEVREYYGIPFDSYGILVFHSVVTELSSLRRQIENVVDALMESERNFVVLYPNNDNGADMVLETYERLREHPGFRLFPSMRFEYFLTLLKHAEVIVGNSSAGVREAPVYGVPTIDIGTRQKDRYQYSSIVTVPPEKDAVLSAVRNLPESVKPSLHFGKGESAKLFIEALRNSQFWQTSRQKQFRDVAASGAGE